MWIARNDAGATKTLIDPMTGNENNCWHTRVAGPTHFGNY
jgi:hypothetical protein